MKRKYLLSLVVLLGVLPLILIAKEDSRVVAGRIKANAGQAKNIAVLLDRFTAELRKLAADVETTSAGIKDRGNKQQVDALENQIDSLMQKTQFLKEKSDELTNIVAAMDRDSDLLADLAGQKKKKKKFGK